MAEPLSEWPMELLDHPVKDFIAENDVYGRMFYFLRDLLMRFKLRCQRLDLEIELSCMDPLELVHVLKVNPMDKFDRIEDENPALCLCLGAKFLNDTWASPCATLLTMTRESVGLDGTDKTKTSLGQVWELFKPTSTALDKYTVTVARDSFWQVGNFPDAKEVARRRVGLQIHLHDAKLFAFHLLGQGDMQDTRSIVDVGFLGLECMRKNRITKRWPNRLIHSRSDKPGLEKFNRYAGWVDNKPQRWLEWQLEEPLDEEHFDYWAHVCTTLTLKEMRDVIGQVLDRMQKGQVEATADSDAEASINLDWIDEETHVEPAAGTSTKSSKAEKKSKGKTKGKKKSGKAKK
ncbi:hypothetical protein E4U43_004050 [Claviceps pusilla]|uniref:Uncharacterized protein n=1 Tax=Claviceps pusilla TaxID=123648 RepID=A0A9P7SX58_9HYPO|nr:hypothetical protein E4U43_004050 [Claviceps pusilla]